MRFLLSIGVFFLFVLPSTAFAATLSFFPPSVELKNGDAVEFVVRIKSEHAINTVGTAIILPPDITFLSLSLGNVISQWIERPTFNKTDNTVSFSGIITNGWRGEGTLAFIKVAARKDGRYSLSFDPVQTEIYQNDGNATPEPVVFGKISNIGKAFLHGAGIVLIVLIVAIILVRRKYKIIFI